MTKPTGKAQSETLPEAALEGFLHMVKVWGLGPEEGSRMLGLKDPTVLDAWREHPQVPPTPEVLIRTSHLLSVHRALTTLIPDSAQAKAWLRRPNGEARFKGQTPIAMMSSPSLEDLEAVHAVLNGRLNVW